LAGGQASKTTDTQIVSILFIKFKFVVYERHARPGGIIWTLFL
jgi:hypothetical protein